METSLFRPFVVNNSCWKQLIFNDVLSSKVVEIWMLKTLRNYSNKFA